MTLKLRKMLLPALSILFMSVSLADISVLTQDNTASVSNPAYFNLAIESEERKLVDVEAEAPGETTVAPEKLNVSPGENESVNIWFLPDRDLQRGKYALDITVSSSDGTETVSPNVRVRREHSIIISEFEGRSCSYKRVTMMIKNSGYSIEDLRVRSESSVIDNMRIQPGETKTLNISRTDVGKFISVNSQDSYAHASRYLDSCNKSENQQGSQNNILGFLSAFKDIL